MDSLKTLEKIQKKIFVSKSDEIPLKFIVNLHMWLIVPCIIISYNVYYFIYNVYYMYSLIAIINNNIAYLNHMLSNTYNV